MNYIKIYRLSINGFQSQKQQHIHDSYLNKEDFKKIAKVSSELENLNIIIDDNPILTIPSLRTRARRLKRIYDIDMILSLIHI